MRNIIKLLSILLYGSALLIMLATVVLQNNDYYSSAKEVIEKVKLGREYKAPILSRQKEKDLEQPAANKLYEQPVEMNDTKKQELVDIPQLIESFTREQNENRGQIEDIKDRVTELMEHVEQDANVEKTVKGAPSTSEEPLLLTILGDGIFLPGQGDIDDRHFRAIQVLIPAIENVIPEYHVLIEGYTDNIPVRKSNDNGIKNNIELSFLRANAAAIVLEEGGIPRKFIATKGYGEADPIASNKTPEGRAKNRRIEIILVPSDYISH